MMEPGPIRRDPKYRPNYDRSIIISGIIDDALVSSLLPKIVALQAASREPITVFIDSPGGDTECAQLILDALRASDQDGSVGCRLITVTLGEASSAASDILIAGDYALAYPYSKILCHGTRIKPLSSFTKDQAAVYAKYMTGQDEGFAIKLARNSIDRFMFRVVKILQGESATASVKFGESESSDHSISQIVYDFLLTHHHINRALLKALEGAIEKADKVAKFSNDVGLFEEHGRAGASDDFTEKIRVAILNNAINRRAAIGPSFSDLEPEFLILCDFFDAHHVGMVLRLLLRWGSDLISPHQTELTELMHGSDQGPSPTDLAGALCTELWFLFVFFCRQLQTGDFPMSATEAYWLGLIDEVIGIDMPSPRVLVENAPDIPASVEGGFQEGFQGARQP